MKQTDVEKLKQYILDTESRMAHLSGTLSVIRYADDVMMEQHNFPCIIALLDDYTDIMLEEFQRIVKFDVDTLSEKESTTQSLKKKNEEYIEQVLDRGRRFSDCLEWCIKLGKKHNKHVTRTRLSPNKANPKKGL